MDPDAELVSAIFVIDLQDVNKKVFLLITYEGTSSFFKDKKSQNSRNQGFSSYFSLMIEGSSSGAGSLSILLTSGSGSGSGRPKNMWIRIRNTASNLNF